MMLGLCCRADCDLLSLHLTNNNKITSLPHRSKPAFTPLSWVPFICPSVNYVWILSQMELIKQTLLYTFHKRKKKYERSGKEKCMKQQSNVYEAQSKCVELLKIHFSSTYKRKKRQAIWISISEPDRVIGYRGFHTG